MYQSYEEIEALLGQNTEDDDKRECERTMEIFKSSLVLHQDKHLAILSPGEEKLEKKKLLDDKSKNEELSENSIILEAYDSKWLNAVRDVYTLKRAQITDAPYVKLMQDALRTVRVDGGNLRQLITILVHVVNNKGQQESRLKRLYIDYEGINPKNWDPISKYEIDCVKYLADTQNVPFDSTAFPIERGMLKCENDGPKSWLTIRKLRVIIAILFSTDTFPEMVQLACHKHVLELFRDFNHNIKNMVPSLALRDSAFRGSEFDQPLSWDRDIVSILSDSMPAKHLFLEGPITKIPIQEGQGLRNHSDITFHKISPGSAEIGHLIDLRATKLSAFRYIAEDHQERIGANWTDPLTKILDDLNSTQGKCLNTLCLGLFNPPQGYSGLPVPPSMGLLESLTHLWIDSGKKDARWTYETIRTFAKPEHYAQNLFHLRITGPRKNLVEWIRFMRTEGKSVWKHLKIFSINDKDLVKQNSQSLMSVGVKLKLVGENDDIRLWTNEGDELEKSKDDKSSRLPPRQTLSNLLN